MFVIGGHRPHHRRCPRWGSNPHWDPFKGSRNASLVVVLISANRVPSDLAAGTSARIRHGPLLPVPLVLAALLVPAAGARVALAPARSATEGALAAVAGTWTIVGR